MSRRLVAPLVAVALASCGRGQPSPSSSGALDSAGWKPAVQAAPPQKEYTETPVDLLGKLPADVGIPIGASVPAVDATDLDGHPVALGDLIARGPVLLVFYRGGWCPYCNFEIHELAKAYPEYRARGVTPVAISADKPDEASKTRAEYVLPFPVLSDSDLIVHEAFHVVHHAGDAEIAKLRAHGIDVDESSDRDHHGFAIPALFLIDRQGTIRWAHADPDYTRRPRTPQILAAIAAAGL